MRLIDADAFIRFLAEQKVKETGAFTKGVNKALNIAISALKNLQITPTVDAVPVVRCKGCEHSERYERTDGIAGYYCGHPQNTFVFGDRWDRVFKPVKKPDDFCSRGQRRGQSADVRNMGQFAGGGKTGGLNDADQH